MLLVKIERHEVCAATLSWLNALIFKLVAARISNDHRRISSDHRRISSDHRRIYWGDVGGVGKDDS